MSIPMEIIQKYAPKRISGYRIRRFKEEPDALIRMTLELARETFAKHGQHPLSMFVLSTVTTGGAPDYAIWGSVLEDVTPENKEEFSAVIRGFARATQAICVINVSEAWMTQPSEEGVLAMAKWRAANPTLSMSEMPGRREMLILMGEMHERNWFYEAEIRTDPITEKRSLGEWVELTKNIRMGQGTVFGNFLRPLQN